MKVTSGDSARTAARATDITDEPFDNSPRGAAE
jgi:hypothetical protein